MKSRPTTGISRARAARTGGQLIVHPGALGGIDALAAARHMGLAEVEHRIVKPARAWAGTEAERLCPLDALTAPAAFFSGTDERDDRTDDAKLAFVVGNLDKPEVSVTMRFVGFGNWAEVLSADAYEAFEEAARERGSVLDPIRKASTSRAHWRPSRMAQTTSDCPRRTSPAANTLATFVA